jgi:hypothetical protein
VTPPVTRKEGLGASPLRADRATDAPHGAAGASPPSGSVSTGAAGTDAERIVLDVWGGTNSMAHVARYLPTIHGAWAIARAELAAGYLVNLRKSAVWGEVTTFDDRAGEA